MIVFHDVLFRGGPFDGQMRRVNAAASWLHVPSQPWPKQHVYEVVRVDGRIEAYYRGEQPK